MSKRKSKAHIGSGPKSTEKLIKQRSRDLPIGKCYVNSDWEDMRIANVVVTREHVNGYLSFAFINVDLALFGVKDVHYGFNVFPDEVEAIISNEQIPFMEVQYNLIHNIVYSGLEWAEDYGFLPHKKWAIARYVFEEDTENIPLIEIECGIHGKPAIFEVATNSFKSDIKKLEETAGIGNFSIFSEEDDYFEENSEEGFVESIINEDLVEICPEFFDEGFDLFEYLDKEDSDEISAAIINKIYYDKIGGGKFDAIDLIEYTIGDKDVHVGKTGIAAEDELVAEINNRDVVPKEEEIALAIEKFPNNSDLFRLLYIINGANETWEEDYYYTNAKRIYEKFESNLIATGYYLSQLAYEKGSMEFNKALRELDFYNEVLNYSGDIPYLLFIYYCAVKANEFLFQNNLEEADIYYYAARIFCSMFDEPVIAFLSAKIAAEKGKVLQKTEQKHDKNESSLKIVHSK